LDCEIRRETVNRGLYESGNPGNQRKGADEVSAASFERPPRIVGAPKIKYLFVSMLGKHRLGIL
jgi:hypothetical protein